MLVKEHSILHIPTNLIYLYFSFYKRKRLIKLFLKFFRDVVNFDINDFFLSFNNLKYLPESDRRFNFKKRRKRAKIKIAFLVYKKKKKRKNKRLRFSKMYNFDFIKETIAWKWQSKKFIKKFKNHKLLLLLKKNNVEIFKKRINRRFKKYLKFKRKRRNWFRTFYRIRKNWKYSRNFFKLTPFYQELTLQTRQRRRKVNFLKFQQLKNCFKLNVNVLQYPLSKRVFYTIKKVYKYFKFFYAKATKYNVSLKNYTKLKNLIFYRNLEKTNLIEENTITLVDVDKPLLRKLRLVRQAHWKSLRTGKLNRERYSKLLLSTVDYSFKNITKNLLTSLLVSFFFKVLSWRQVKMCLKFHLFSINRKFTKNFVLQKGDTVETLMGFYLLNFIKFSKKFSKKHIFRVKKWLYVSYLYTKYKKLKKRQTIPSYVIKNRSGFYQPNMNWVVDYSTNTAVYKSVLDVLKQKQFDDFHVTTLVKINNWRYNV